MRIGERGEKKNRREGETEGNRGRNEDRRQEKVRKRDGGMKGVMIEICLQKNRTAASQVGHTDDPVLLRNTGSAETWELFF